MIENMEIDSLFRKVEQIVDRIETLDVLVAELFQEKAQLKFRVSELERELSELKRGVKVEK